MINERIKRILLLLDEKQIRRIKRTDKEYVYLFACCLDKDENVTVIENCEYILVKSKTYGIGLSVTSITHKGNCKYCSERNNMKR